jgi:hypothetical protein
MEKDYNWGLTMIFFTWGIWFLITIFNVVILLNFLITYISETYEEVYGRDKIDDFANMAQLNHECRIVTKPVYMLFTSKLVKILVVIPLFFLSLGISYVIIILFCCAGPRCFCPNTWKYFEMVLKFIWENFGAFMKSKGMNFDYIIVSHADDYQIMDENAFLGIIKTIRRDNANNAFKVKKFVH